MSTRWFFSSARVGAVAAAAGGPALATSVTFTQHVDGRRGGGRPHRGRGSRSPEPAT